MNKRLILSLVLINMVLFSSQASDDKVITVPAQKEQGIEVEMQEGSYTAVIEGGAISLFYPINPNYQWLIGVAVGAKGKGGQSEADLGTIYFQPDPKAEFQSEAEEQALKAVKENRAGTSLDFILDSPQKVRFWVSDYDYSDNSGMVKVRIIKKR